MNLFSKIFGLFEEAKYEECLRLCNRGIKQYPSHYYAWFYKGKSLYELGDFEQAITAFIQSLNLGPNEDQIWLSLACARDANGEKLEAYRCYRKETELFPDSAFAWESLAIFLCRNKRFSVARRIFRLIDAKGLMNYEFACLDYAKSIYEAGTLDEEIALYNKLISLGIKEKWVTVNMENARKAVTESSCNRLAEESHEP